MKKLIGISLFSVSLLFSCQKEQIKVTDSQSVETPEWKETRGAMTSNGSTVTTTTVSSGSGITDPNNDPDMNAKKVVKQ